MYEPGDLPAPQTTLDAAGDRDWHPYLGSAQDKQPPKSMVVGFPELEASAETTADLRAVYLGLASEVDHHIGRVIDWLKASGQWDDTILVVTSDHGEMLGDFGLWGKATFHDAAFHVPLIVRDPARPEMHGRAVGGMTESIDVSVSLIERLGGEVPHSMNGTSILAMLDDTNVPGKTATFSEYDFGNPVQPTNWMEELGLHSSVANLAVLRTERHRLVQFGCDLPPVLFDMEGDGEALDVSGQPNEMSNLLDLTRHMLCYRMVNPESTFARTIVGNGGVRTGAN